MPLSPKRWRCLVRGVTVCVAATTVLAGIVSPTVLVHAHAHADGDRPHCHSGGHIHWHDSAAGRHGRALAGEHTHANGEVVRHCHECLCSPGADRLGARNSTAHFGFAATTRHAHVYWWGVAISLPCGSPDVPGQPHDDEDCGCLACWMRELDRIQAAPLKPVARLTAVSAVPPCNISSATESTLLPAPLLPTLPLCDRARHERSGVLRA